MQTDTLTVVGVGLLGGSIALAARQRQAARRVVGAEANAAALSAALERGLVDEGHADLRPAVAGADLVVFCTPVDGIAAQVLAAAPACRPGAVLTDVGSTKAGIIRALEGRVPGHVAFVGGHPLAGSEKHGADHARADLFDG